MVTFYDGLGYNEFFIVFFRLDETASHSATSIATAVGIIALTQVLRGFVNDDCSFYDRTGTEEVDGIIDNVNERRTVSTDINVTEVSQMLFAILAPVILPAERVEIATRFLAIIARRSKLVNTKAVLTLRQPDQVSDNVHRPVESLLYQLQVAFDSAWTSKRHQAFQWLFGDLQACATIIDIQRKSIL